MLHKIGRHVIFPAFQRRLQILGVCLTSHAEHINSPASMFPPDLISLLLKTVPVSSLHLIMQYNLLQATNLCVCMCAGNNRSLPIIERTLCFWPTGVRRQRSQTVIP